MATRTGIIAAAIAAAMLSFESRASAQGDAYKARLSPTPVENSTVAGITGSGLVTATLIGRSLAVRGTFEDMRSPATIAQIRLGPRGVRGPVMFDLTATKGTSGSLTGTFTLTPEQVEAVKRGRFYVQIHSEKSAEGNLWGWLLPAAP